MPGEYFAYIFDFKEKRICEILKSNYEIFSKHIQYLKNVKELGKLQVAGITQQKEKEVILLNVQDEKLAEAIFLNDPLRKSNFFCSYFYRANISHQSISFLCKHNKDCKNEEILENYKKTKTKFFLSFFRKNRNIPSSSVITQLDILHEHHEYVKKKILSNKFIITGLINDEKIGNIILIYAEDIDEATLLLKNDPIISKKLFNFEVYPFNILLVG